MHLYLAGAETWGNLLMDMGVKNSLFSYFYLRTQMERNGPGAKLRALFSRMERAKKKGYRFFLDSGAFTYQVNKKQQKSPKLYFEEFRDFVFEYHYLFDIIAEFDVEGCKDGHGGTIPLTQVDEWTDSMLEVSELRRKIMPVYHDARGHKWLSAWLADTRSPLVGYGSDVGAQFAGPVISDAHRWGKWIHGFGQTGVNTTLRYTAFDSVDSSTWLRGDKYGGTCIYTQSKLIVLDHQHKGDRARYKWYFDQWGLDWKKLAADDLHEVRKSTIIAWRELANALENSATVRGHKHPYLYRLADAGKTPAEHPMLAKKV